MNITKLALFPLQIVVLPGERIVLHIFEERYQQLIIDCEKHHISFGIPFSSDGNIPTIGSEVHLLRIMQRHANGSLDIEIEGTQVFRINSFYPQLDEKLYPGGDVEIEPEIPFQQISTKLLDAVDDYLLNSGDEVNPEIFKGKLNIFDLGKILQLNDQDKARIIQSSELAKRESIVWNHIEQLKKLKAQSKSFDGRNFLN